MSFGVRRILMTLDKFFCKMDSLEFQVQFSVLSGFSSVRRAFARDETVQNMIAEMRDGNPQDIHTIYEHLRNLLNECDSRMYDESIAAYLYCLEQIDILVAQNASNDVLSLGGVWWSTHMALHIKNFVDQIQASISFSSIEYQTTGYNTGDESLIDNYRNPVLPAEQLVYCEQGIAAHPIKLAFAS